MATRRAIKSILISSISLGGLGLVAIFFLIAHRVLRLEVIPLPGMLYLYADKEYDYLIPKVVDGDGSQREQSVEGKDYWIEQLWWDESHIMTKVAIRNDKQVATEYNLYALKDQIIFRSVSYEKILKKLEENGISSATVHLVTPDQALKDREKELGWSLGKKKILKYASAIGELNYLTLKIKQHKDRNEKYPQDLSEIDWEGSEPWDVDPWGRKYEYEYLETGSYNLWSYGPCNLKKSIEVPEFCKDGPVSYRYVSLD